MIETLGWHKDKWLDIDRIFIAANNRGLKFADGIFETILIKEKKPVLFDDHLKRLEKSSKILNINLKINKLTFRKLIHDGIRKLSLKNDQFASVRINYSRGTNVGRKLTIDSTLETKDLDNLWLEFYKIKPNFNPISVFISQTEKINEFSLINKCKTFSYNQAIQVLTEANEKSFDDSILLNTSGELCCGSTFNLLIKRNNEFTCNLALIEKNEVTYGFVGIPANCSNKKLPTIAACLLVPQAIISILSIDSKNFVSKG